MKFAKISILSFIGAFVLLVAAAPTPTYAASHYYSCSGDSFAFYPGATITCTGAAGDAFTFSSTGNEQSYLSPDSLVPYTGSFFIVASSTGTTGHYFFHTDTGDDSPDFNASGVSQEATFVLSAATPTGIHLISGNNNFNHAATDAVVTFCISDSAYSDCLPSSGGGGGGSGIAASQSDYSVVGGSTQSTSTISFTGVSGIAGLVHFKVDNYTNSGTLSYATYLVDETAGLQYLCDGHGSPWYEIPATNGAQDLTFDCHYGNVLTGAPSSVPLSLVSGHTYHFSLFRDTGSTDVFKPAGNGVSPYFIFEYFSTGSVTDIFSVTPPNDIDGSNARATSTTFAFGATGYIATGDLVVPGTYIEIKWIPNDYDQLASAYCSVGGCYTSRIFVLSSSGAFNVSTTTDIQRPGWYSLKTTLYAPHQVFGVTVPFWNDTLVATSTDFLVATASPIDVIKRAVASTTQNIITGQASPTAYCSFSTTLAAFDFNAQSNILTCLLGVASGLTVPSAAQSAAIQANFSDSVSTRIPFGYATRFLAIVSGHSGTTTLPSLVIKVPPLLARYTGDAQADFTPWNSLMSSSSPFGSATSSTSTGSKTFRQIAEPGWWVIIFALVAVVTMFDIMKVKH